MQDFTGVPAVVDLAAMRDAMVALGGDPEKINPLVPVDLVIDHSVQVDDFGTADAFERNVELEYERNSERYAFLRWGQTAFDNFRVVPPGTGICHQVNLEYLAQVVWTATGGQRAGRLSRHAGRHRLPHHHDQRPGRARLGRGRHRGRGRDARPADLDADPRGRRLQADRRAAGRRDRHRPRAHRHPDAAQEGRGRQVRRVLRPGPRPACRSPTAPPSPTWRRSTAPPAASSRSTPTTLDYLRLTGRDAGARRPGRGLCQGAGPVARTTSTPDPVFTDTLELDLGDGRAVARRPEAAAGPRAARRRPSRASRTACLDSRATAPKDAKRAGRGRRTTTSATATW